MTIADIIRYRLINQQIAETKFKKPHEVVSWLGAMQAQEFAMVKWAIGLRLPGVNDADVEKAFNRGDILRTHLLRPTWHFVTPADIRWLLALTAPRVNATNAYWYKKFELDEAVFKRSHRILEKMLEGGKHLTRETLNAELERNKIVAKGLRLGYLFMHAELDGLICSGPRESKQFTYALLEERVPKVKAIHREQALAELTNRYFSSRGPATLQDFVYWSGLTMKDAKEGEAMLKKNVVREKTDSQDYIFVPPVSKRKALQTTFLMPDYDEYGMSYKNRSALVTQKEITGKNPDPNPDYSHWLVVNGAIEGTWQRTIRGKTVVVEATPFTTLSKTEKQAVALAVEKYKSFTGHAIEEPEQRKKK